MGYERIFPGNEYHQWEYTKGAGDTEFGWVSEEAEIGYSVNNHKTPFFSSMDAYTHYSEKISIISIIHFVSLFIIKEISMIDSF